MRRLFVFVVVSVSTAVASTWWLYQGDLAEAVAPVTPEWNADALAIQAGIVDLPSSRPALEPGPGADPADVD
jgi:hypothetical protein